MGTVASWEFRPSIKVEAVSSSSLLPFGKQGPMLLAFPFFFFFKFIYLLATPVACGSSWARDRP